MIWKLLHNVCCLWLFSEAHDHGLCVKADGSSYFSYRYPNQTQEGSKNGDHNDTDVTTKGGG